MYNKNRYSFWNEVGSIFLFPLIFLIFKQYSMYAISAFNDMLHWPSTVWCVSEHLVFWKCFNWPIELKSASAPPIYFLTRDQRHRLVSDQSLERPLVYSQCGSGLKTHQFQLQLHVQLFVHVGSEQAFTFIYYFLVPHMQFTNKGNTSHQIHCEL